MKEDFLHYLWKLKLVANQNLMDNDNCSIVIINPGQHNLNEGPDFLNAKIKIDNQLWAGDVEIHLKSSDWYVHNHERDPNYDAVILHVVWEDDMPVFGKGNHAIPTLILKNFVSKDILNKYHKLFGNKQVWINCESQIGAVDNFVINNWLEILFIERLEQKSLFIDELLKTSHNDWEAVFFKLLIKNFGLKVNGAAFFELAKSIDFNILRKVRPDLTDMEALLFGQAHLLEKNDIEDSYFLQLKNSYNYLLAKFKLRQNLKSGLQFFRLRPDNFPTIRLAQLAALYHIKQNLFSQIINCKTIDEVYNLFNFGVSNYWQTHYTFKSATKSKRHQKLTKNFIDLLIINTIIPIFYVYQKSQGKDDFVQLFNLMQAIKPESNTIIKRFAGLGIKADSAFYTQALIQLKNKYCTKKRCLHCQIGHALLKNNSKN